MTALPILEHLRSILDNLDENGTPTEKMPDCPWCGEDELGVINPQSILCYSCGWRIYK